MEEVSYIASYLSINTKIFNVLWIKWYQWNLLGYILIVN